MHQEENSLIVLYLCQIELPLYPNALKYIVPQKFVACFLHIEEIAVLCSIYFPFSFSVDLKQFIMLLLLSLCA